MIYNYHTHTWRCSHAEGKEEDYIKTAVKNGIKYMGFSDHFPFSYPDGFEASFRVPVAEAEYYVLDLLNLREKYKKEIDIKIGFEMEYYPEYFSDMMKNAKKYGCEYLILGQHYINGEHPEEPHTITETDSVERLKEYAFRVVEAIKSRVFTYVAHPDIINFNGDISIYQNEIRKICIAAKEYNIPLEMNFLGIRTHRNYPNENFWKIAGEEQSPVTFGFDAHDVDSAFDGNSLLRAKELVKKYNLNYIGIPEVKLIQNMK